MCFLLYQLFVVPLCKLKTIKIMGLNIYVNKPEFLNNRDLETIGDNFINIDENKELSIFDKFSFDYIVQYHDIKSGIEWAKFTNGMM